MSAGGSHRYPIPLELKLHSCELPSVGTENQTRVLCKSRASFNHGHISSGPIKSLDFIICKDWLIQIGTL